MGDEEIDFELDAQAEVMAEQALAALPPQVRATKLPAVKEKILKQLKEQTQKAAQPKPLAQEQPAPPTEPPKRPSLTSAQRKTVPLPESLTQNEDIEMVGDWHWYADDDFRDKLQDAVISAHAETKISVGSGADEIERICPSDGRVIMPGAVLRLGGAHLGGYGENDIASVYRSLSRALHPDKNQGIANAHDAFKRLKDAADELRTGLTDTREMMNQLSGLMAVRVDHDRLERPQAALFAEASRLLFAVIASTGEGEVPRQSVGRMRDGFRTSYAFGEGRCKTDDLHKLWYSQTKLIDMIASDRVRNAYDCAPKRLRAAFLCGLNRSLICEAKREEGCVRSDWQGIFNQYPELGIWRELRELISSRLMEITRKKKKKRKSKFDEGAPGDGGDEAEAKRAKRRSMWDKDGGDASKSGDDKMAEKNADEPVCLAFAQGACKKGDSCTFAHRKAEEGEGKQEASEGTGEGQQNNDEELGPDEEWEEVKDYTDWAKRSRAAITAILPSSWQAPLPIGNSEVQLLCAAIWRDVSQSMMEDEQSMKALGLFRTDSSGMEYWAFVPSADLLLTIGEGICGITAGGAFCIKTPANHKKKTFGVAVLGEEPLPEPEKKKEDDEAEDGESKEGGQEDEKRESKVRILGPVAKPSVIIGGRTLPAPKPVTTTITPAGKSVLTPRPVGMVTSASAPGPKPQVVISSRPRLSLQKPTIITPAATSSSTAATPGAVKPGPMTVKPPVRLQTTPIGAAPIGLQAPIGAAPIGANQASDWRQSVHAPIGADPTSWTPQATPIGADPNSWTPQAKASWTCQLCHQQNDNSVPVCTRCSTGWNMA